MLSYDPKYDLIVVFQTMVGLVSNTPNQTETS